MPEESAQENPENKTKREIPADAQLVSANIKEDADAVKQVAKAKAEQLLMSGLKECVTVTLWQDRLVLRVQPGYLEGALPQQ